MILTWILVRGVRESATTNNVMVMIKIAAILIFVIGAARAVDTSNWHPFAPNGFPAVLTGAAIVFFTYIGFDSVSTAAEECRRPQRDLPFGIITTLVICAILYIAVALVLTGIARYDTLNNAAPVADALKVLGYNRIRQWVSDRGDCGHDLVAAGVSVRAGAHLVRHVARRPAAARCFRRCTRFTRRRTSARGSRAWSWESRRASGISRRSRICRTSGRCLRSSWSRLGVIVLRKTQPDRPRGFRVPGAPWLPMISIAFCLVLMMALPLETWVRFFVWLFIGFAIYFPFGRKHSALARA